MLITQSLTDFEKFILSLPRYKDSNPSPENLFKKFTVENTDIEERAWVGRYIDDSIDYMAMAYHTALNDVAALIGAGATISETADYIISQTTHQSH